ncbi:MAG: hypothetical protein ACWGOY_10310 [Anaerolineales bacterium]
MIAKKTNLLAWFLMLLSAGMMFFVSFAGGFQRDPGLYLPIALVYIVLGGLLAIRIPKNAIGWMFLVGVFFLILNVSMVWYANLGLVVKPGSLPGADYIAAVLPAFEVIGYALVLIFPFFLFPDGHLLSRRWKPVLYLAGFATLLNCFEIFRPGPLTIFPDWNNPMGIAQLSFYFEVSEFINGILAVVLFIVAPISIILRYRWASNIGRQQIKWFVLAGIFVSIWILFMVLFSDSLPEIIIIVFESIVLASIPLAIAIAMLRYHLWDIDIIIRRTLQYTLLTGLLVLIYFSSVVLLQNLVETITGEQSPVVIVISTLGIAALFNPLRIRVQDFIDQRFYRKKYDAERAMTQFTETARDEVDMQNLILALMGVVEETMQPKKIILWLQSHEDEHAS